MTLTESRLASSLDICQALKLKLMDGFQTGLELFCNKRPKNSLNVKLVSTCYSTVSTLKWMILQLTHPQASLESLFHTHVQSVLNSCACMSVMWAPRCCQDYHLCNIYWAAVAQTLSHVRFVFLFNCRLVLQIKDRRGDMVVSKTSLVLVLLALTWNNTERWRVSDTSCKGLRKKDWCLSGCPYFLM